LSSSSGGLLFSSENGESSSFPPLVESTKNRIPEEFLLRRESSAVASQVEYSFLPPKTGGSPHFLLLWRILLIPSVLGEFSKRRAPSEFLLRKAYQVTWLWDRTSRVMTASFRKSSDKTTCIFIHELYKNDDKNEGLLKSTLICQILVSLNQFFKVQACYTVCSESFYIMRSA